MTTKKLTVSIDGYGGEHTIGKLTDEQVAFWKEKDEDELVEHVESFDDNPELTDEQYIGPWYENDNIDHTYGAHYDIEITIKFGDEEHIFKTKDYTLDKLKTSKNVIVKKNKIKPGSYLVCFSEERGNFVNAEQDIDENDKFDINDFEFVTKDIRGEVFFTGVRYKGVEMDQDAIGTVGKGFNAEILSDEDLLDY